MVVVAENLECWERLELFVPEELKVEMAEFLECRTLLADWNR